MNITYLSAISATLTNGSKSITVTGEHVDFSKADDYLAVVDNGLYVLRVESGTAPDGNGDSTLILVDAWSGATLTNKNLFVFPTFAKIYESVAAMSALNDVTRGILTKLKDLLTATTPTIDIAVGQTSSITTVPYQYLIDQLQAAIANNAQLISDEVAASLAKIRYSKLDNPLCHLFKKNKLVDTLSGVLSWTRASGATYIDRYGVLKYSPSPSATNLCLYSEDFSNAAWNDSRLTIDNNSFLSPKGSLNADKLIATSVSGSHQAAQVVSALTGDDLTLSCFAKPGGLDYIRLNIYDGNNHNVIINLVDGSVYSTTDGCVSSISVGGGYYRVSLTITLASDDPQVIISPSDSSSSFTGNDIDGIIAWGAQVELSRVANAYVKTETTSESGTSYLGIEQSRQEKDGWLIEGVSTNYIRNSQDFSSLWEADGTGYRATIVSSDNVAPDGSLTAILVEDIDEVARYVRQVVTVSSGLTATCSIYVKQDTSDTCGIRMAWTGGSTVFQGVDFSFVTKTFSGSITNIELSYIELGDGWFRLIMTLTAPVDNTTVDFRAYPASVISGASIGRSYMWGCQVEVLPFASSYIPTTDSAVTSAADVVSCTSYENVPKTTEPWSFSVWSNPYKAGKFAGSYSVTDAAGGNVISIANNGSSYYGQVSTDSGNLYVGIDSSVPVEQLAQLTTTYDGEYLRFFVNGVQKGDSVLVSGNIGETNGIVFPRGNSYSSTQDFRIYDFALSADEISFLAGE
jgi:Concanavalin A-like lectin/glucanases superfamily